MEGLIPETPKEGERIFANVKNVIIGSNGNALEAAYGRAKELGFDAEIVSRGLRGEAREAGRWLAREAMRRRTGAAGRPLALISGGETTVTVRGSGKGGRNTELALAFAMEIGGRENIAMLSAGTDGTDGPTDAAGAVVDGKTVETAKASGLDPSASLGDNDSYNFFSKIDGLFITGPTGTNVMDIQVIIIE
jgi:hydroxypyruvate reductase/glycerate 2-kinase